jgi:NACalpha-BTF3-like transcription factor
MIKTGRSYEEARAALEKSGGVIQQAIKILES